MSDAPPPGHVCTIRGAAVTSTLHYVAREFGESSLGWVIGEIGDSYKDVLDLDLLLAEQVDERAVVPVKLLLDLMDRVGRRYLPDSGGGLELAERAGVYAAYEAQPLLRRIVINLASPQMLVQRAAQLWSHYYNCGVLTSEQLGGKGVRLTVSGFHAAHPLWCRRLTGYYREVLRRSSGRQARMSETQCVTRGAPLCEWKGDWSGSSLF